MAEEFALIRAIRTRIETLNRHHGGLIVPPGDDAALLSGLTRPVVTTDCQRQDVHFRLDWQSPEEIGFKAVVVTLSDLAASFAEPVALFVNLGLPDGFNQSAVLRLYDGISEAIGAYPCTLGGGNIAKAPVLSLDLFALGQGHETLFPLRSTARPGQGLYVTGPLGLARAGLDSLSRGIFDAKNLITCFKRPRARFDAARILSEHNINCLMDISDGLSGDVRHMAEASDISIRFDIDPARIPPDLKTYCDRFSLSAMDMMLAGGEDYELLFTCDPETFDTLASRLPDAFRVGDCLPFEGDRLINPPTSARSFVHSTQE